MWGLGDDIGMKFMINDEWIWDFIIWDFIWEQIK